MIKYTDFVDIDDKQSFLNSLTEGITEKLSKRLDERRSEIASEMLNIDENDFQIGTEVIIPDGRRGTIQDINGDRNVPGHTYVVHLYDGGVTIFNPFSLFPSASNSRAIDVPKIGIAGDPEAAIMQVDAAKNMAGPNYPAAHLKEEVDAKKIARTNSITRALKTAYKTGTDPRNSHTDAAKWFKRQASQRKNVNEDEQIDELKKSTYASYIKQAAGKGMDKAYYAGANPEGSTKRNELLMKSLKRERGIIRAADKLAK